VEQLQNYVQFAIVEEDDLEHDNVMLENKQKMDEMESKIHKHTNTPIQRNEQCKKYINIH
jgi:hypothetical protein